MHVYQQSNDSLRCLVGLKMVTSREAVQALRLQCGLSDPCIPIVHVPVPLCTRIPWMGPMGHFLTLCGVMSSDSDRKLAF
jgi:hypothetical protein